MAEKKRLRSMAALREMEAALLEKLTHARKELKAAEAAERARKKTAQRREDARRKLLHGVAVLAAVEAGDVDAATVRGWCERFIKRANEREFLKLPPLPVQEKAEGAGDA